MQLRRLQVIFLFVLVSLVGCQQNNAAHPPNSSTPLVNPVSTLTSVPSLVPTFSPVPTLTVTASLQPTATITLTPLPTMPGDKIQAKFDQLYQYNNGCKLPCWWGITPGITTWGEARNFLMQFEEHSELREDHSNPLTQNPSGFTHATFIFPSPNYPYNRYGTMVDFEIQNGAVVAIKLMGDVSRWMFDLKKLYQEYGDPDRILIVPSDCPQNPSGCLADMFFMYDKQGFLSQSFAYSSEVNETTVSLCASEEDSGEITTWASGISINLRTTNKNDPKFITLDEVVRARISEMFKNSRNSNKQETCFDVPKEFWK